VVGRWGASTKPESIMREIERVDLEVVLVPTLHMCISSIVSGTDGNSWVGVVGLRIGFSEAREQIV
jgi:hypothetical protein